MTVLVTTPLTATPDIGDGTTTYFTNMIMVEYGNQYDGTGNGNTTAGASPTTLTGSEIQTFTVIQTTAGGTTAAQINNLGNGTSERLDMTVDTWDSATGSYWRYAGGANLPDNSSFTFADGFVLQPGDLFTDGVARSSLEWKSVSFREYDANGDWTGGFVNSIYPWAAYTADGTQLLSQADDRYTEGWARLEALIAEHGPITTVYSSGRSTGNQSSQPYGAGGGAEGTLTPGVTAAPCFTAGTLIKTPTGLSKVEDLVAGDLVMTKYKGAMPLLWVGATKVKLGASADNRPIVFDAGSILGNTELLIVSPNHAVVVRGAMAEILFGKPEVLVLAKSLVNDKDVKIDFDAKEAHYCHIMFENHEIVYCADGTKTESLFVGAESIKGFGAESRSEILSLFPELADSNAIQMSPAARILVTHEAKVLSAFC